jgi:hypothetical protein
MVMVVAIVFCRQNKDITRYQDVNGQSNGS